MRLPSRDRIFTTLATDPAVDVLIVGGGINGAGLLRELALNGVTALLVDRQDFAAGATAASSRMIHGGLRYLENGEFRLVRESLRERDRLLRLAPHAVRPLPTTIPIFTRGSGFGNAVRRFLGWSARPAPRGALLVKIGLTLYDLFTARHRTLPTHHFTRRTEALRLRPQLHSKIICTATYHDAQVCLPERLCLELIADACAVNAGIRALNYCALLRNEHGTVVLQDTLSDREFRVTPRVVVNATGGWIDFTNVALGTTTRWIGGTKGSHLVVNHPELLAACRDEQLFYENPDGRICIFFPVNGRVLVGSTDIRIDDPDQAVCDEREIDYLLASIRTVFPNLTVTRAHIVSHFCGVRPLPSSDTDFTGGISRDHSCRSLPATADRPWPVLAMIGGKWTTFRAFAEQVANRVLAELNLPRSASTADRPIDGRAALDTHDERALGEILRDEAVVHLDDLLLRRTPIALFEGLDGERFSALAHLAAETLGWDSARLAAEQERARAILASRHGIHFTPTHAHV